MSVFAAFSAGALFALGLALSGMTEPARIIRFLDVTGDWDPSLAFVMGGAVCTYALLYRLIVGKLERPLVADEFHLPARAKPDAKLVIGAALFGVGWGLAGLCPGPALVALGALKREAALFVVAMAAGTFLTSLLEKPGRPGKRTAQRQSFAHDDA